MPKFNNKLKSIFELLNKDSGFKDKMGEFLLKFKEYFEASDNFIDLAGGKNVLFYQNDEGKWTYQIGSVIKGDKRQGQEVEQTMSALEESPKAITQSQEMQNRILNILAVARLVNATGIKAGFGKIIGSSSSIVGKFWLVPIQTRCHPERSDYQWSD